jgi:hypothetical protein
MNGWPRQCATLLNLDRPKPPVDTGGAAWLPTRSEAARDYSTEGGVCVSTVSIAGTIDPYSFGTDKDVLIQSGLRRAETRSRPGPARHTAGRDAPCCRSPGLRRRSSPQACGSSPRRSPCRHCLAPARPEQPRPGRQPRRPAGWRAHARAQADNSAAQDLDSPNRAPAMTAALIDEYDTGGIQRAPDAQVISRWSSLLG